jgi:hypothetical protein
LNPASFTWFTFIGDLYRNLLVYQVYQIYISFWTFGHITRTAVTLTSQSIT